MPKKLHLPQKKKEISLVLISKRKGDADDPSAYRPMDTSRKQLERLFKPRLTADIENGGELFARQYGFRLGSEEGD